MPGLSGQRERQILELLAAASAGPGTVADVGAVPDPLADPQSIDPGIVIGSQGPNPDPGIAIPGSGVETDPGIAAPGNPEAVAAEDRATPENRRADTLTVISQILGVLASNRPGEELLKVLEARRLSGEAAKSRKATLENRREERTFETSERVGAEEATADLSESEQDAINKRQKDEFGFREGESQAERDLREQLAANDNELRKFGIDENSRLRDLDRASRERIAASGDAVREKIAFNEITARLSEGRSNRAVTLEVARIRDNGANFRQVNDIALEAFRLGKVQDAQARAQLRSLSVQLSAKDGELGPVVFDKVVAGQTLDTKESALLADAAKTDIEDTAVQRVLIQERAQLASVLMRKDPVTGEAGLSPSATIRVTTDILSGQDSVGLARALSEEEQLQAVVSETGQDPDQTREAAEGMLDSFLGSRKGLDSQELLQQAESVLATSDQSPASQAYILSRLKKRLIDEGNTDVEEDANFGLLDAILSRTLFPGLPGSRQ